MSDFWIGKLISATIVLAIWFAAWWRYSRQAEASFAAMMADLKARAVLPPVAIGSEQSMIPVDESFADAAKILASIDPQQVPAEGLSGQNETARWRGQAAPDGGLMVTVMPVHDATAP